MRRRAVRRRNVLHDGDELPPFAAPFLELFQLAGQRNSRFVLPRIQQLSDQGDYLLHA